MPVRRVPRLIPAAAAAAVAVAVSGCGSSSVTGVVDPVAKAATITNQTAGMRMNFTMHLTASGLPAPIVGRGSGAFNEVDHGGAFSLTLDFGSIPQVSALLGGRTLTIDEILSGTNVYLKLPPSLARSPALHGKPWAKVNLAKAAGALGIGGFSSLLDNPASSDPSQLLRYLRAASPNVKKLGTATIDGFHTTHYRARIQLARVPNVFPAAQRAQVRRTMSELQQLAHISSIPVDVWIDGQHLVRREALSIDESISGQTVTVALRVDVPQYGPQPAPQLPPPSQVADLTGGPASTTGSAASPAG